MDFAQAPKTCLLFAAVFTCGVHLPPTFAQDSSDSIPEQQQGTIGSVPELARLVWAILDTIEQEHVKAPARHDLIAIVAGQLSGIEDETALQTAVAQIAKCQNADMFAEWLAKFWQGDNQPATSLDQFLVQIMKAMEPVVGRLRLIREKESLVEDQLRNNRYVGIGVTTHSRGEKLAFASVFPGGPADRGGLRGGTIVEEINGRSTENVPLETAIDWIRGPMGTDVILKITDPDHQGESRLVTLKRGVIRLNSVVDRNQSPLSRGAVQEEGSARVKCITITNLTSSTLSELRAADLKAKREGVRVLVLDFQAMSESNDLHQAQLVADGLIDGGTLWYRTERGNQPQPDIADRECLFRGIPLVVILHQRTGAGLSAVAAALRDADRAVIVGDSPEFRGTFTSTVKLAGVPFALELTTAKLTRARRDQRWPMEPDHAAKYPGAGSMNQPTAIDQMNSASEQLGNFARFRAARNLFDQASAIRPLPLIGYPTAEQIAERVANELLKSLPEQIAE